MVTGYTSYKTEIKNVKFIAGDGRTCKQTAIVTLYGSNGEEIGSELFGVIEISEIYRMIKEGDELNLDNCYISDFSLSAYRRYNGLDKKDFVKLKKFSARNSFFEDKSATDFTFAAFSDDDVDFDGAHFAKEKCFLMVRSLAKEIPSFPTRCSGMGILNLQDQYSVTGISFSRMQ